MRVLITGGTGLVGRALSASLIPGGHEVIVLSRTSARTPSLPSVVRVERWDARTADGWGHLADGAGAIVNLAGANPAGEQFFPRRWTDERKRLIRDSRLNAGRAVVQAVEQAAQKPGIVVQASGIGYYGLRGERKFTEDSPPGNDFLARVARDDWEPSTAPVEAMGVRRVIARSGMVLSLDGGALPRLLLPFRLYIGGPLGSGQQWLSWIHLADEVAALHFLIESEEASGPFNLVAPGPITNAEMSRILGYTLKRPAFLPTSATFMRMAFGEAASLVLSGQQAVPRRLLDLGFRFRFDNAEAALRDLLD